MSKELEALNKIESIIDRLASGCGINISELDETFDLENCTSIIAQGLIRLEELKKRDVPMKVVVKYDKTHDHTSYTCPSCGNDCYFSKVYCTKCSQKLDWHKEKLLTDKNETKER